MDGDQARNMVGSGEHERSEADYYPTCPEAVYGLLSKEYFIPVADNKPMGIWEPACGDGAIAEILREHYAVHASDLYDWGYGHTGKDFLTCEFSDLCGHIVTNPPFKLSTEFAYRGVEFIRKTGGKLCLLNRLQWLEGQKRGRTLFKEIPPQRIWVFSKRIPRMHNPRFEGKKTTSMMAFAWFVWDAVDSWEYTKLGWISPEEMKDESK